MMKTIKRIELRSKRVSLDYSGVASPSEQYKGRALTAPEQVAAIAQALLADEEQEVFLVFNLDAHNKILGYVEAGRGAIDACPVDPRSVFRAALIQGASAIIVAHNHPTGIPTPSPEDKALTVRLGKGARLLGVDLLDHVVVGADSYTSFVEDGLPLSER